MMLELQDDGCHNINFVSPSHVVAQIIAAVAIAARKRAAAAARLQHRRLRQPRGAALLDGIVDIYMPDMKYGDSALARKYSKVRDYVAANRAAVKEMHRQVGDLVLDEHGIAQRGLLVRHLVLPDDIAGTEAVLEFLAEEVSPNTYVNLMDQYRPCYRADEYPELDRPDHARRVRGGARRPPDGTASRGSITARYGRSRHAELHHTGHWPASTFVHRP